MKILKKRPNEYRCGSEKTGPEDIFFLGSSAFTSNGTVMAVVALAASKPFNGEEFEVGTES